MLAARAWKCSQNPPVAVRQVLSGRGRGAATDFHGHSGCSGVYSSRLIAEKVGRNEIRLRVCADPQKDEASGL
jgi:hypothetical protein